VLYLSHAEEKMADFSFDFRDYSDRWRAFFDF